MAHGSSPWVENSSIGGVPVDPFQAARLPFPQPLTEAILIRRYKRFLADVELGGECVTVHCPNTGGMLGCDIPGSRVWLSHSDNPRRKYCWTWELVQPPEGPIIGINTLRTNPIVEAALQAGIVPGLNAAGGLRREISLPGLSSRFDFSLAADPQVIIEVKNVTAAVEDGVALFPDAVSQRASRHLRELQDIVAGGRRAVQLYCVQREDVHVVRPATEIDPVYGKTVLEAMEAGVEFKAWGCGMSPEAIGLARQLEFQPE